jgi:hypothetical protein
MAWFRQLSLVTPFFQVPLMRSRYRIMRGSHMKISRIAVFFALVTGLSVFGTAQPDAVLVGAGDIASCDDLAGAQATAKLIDNIPGTVFAAGDLAYPDGSDEQFAKCYGPTWGRFKDRTRPAPGNHEYHSGGASGYVRYFGAAAGDPKKAYYSYDLGEWHIIVLNSGCDEVGGCGAGFGAGTMVAARPEGSSGEMYVGLLAQAPVQFGSSTRQRPRNQAAVGCTLRSKCRSSVKRARSRL